MTQDQLQTAIVMRAQGEGYNKISDTIGLNKGTIHHKLQKDEINQLIKKAQTDLIKNSLTTAINNQTEKIKASAEIVKKVTQGEKLTDGSVKLMELGHDAEKQLLQSVGIHTSHTQSIQVNNILVDNRSELSPAIERMIMAHLGGKVEQEAIDV